MASKIASMIDSRIDSGRWTLAVGHASGQVVLPAAEQVAREFPQLAELAVGGPLRRLQLLRLDEEALLLEGLLQLLPLERLARLALAAGVRCGAVLPVRACHGVLGVLRVPRRRRGELQQTRRGSDGEAPASSACAGWSGK